MKKKSDPTELETGQKLGAYVILEKIDESPVYVAYSAIEPALDRHVAIKILKGPYSKKQGHRIQFKKQACKLAELNHKHIIPLYSICFDNDLYYLATAYIPSYNLQDWINDNRVYDHEEAMQFMTQTVSALEHAQHRGIIHVDLKPRSFLIDWDDIIKIANVGVAQCRNLLLGMEKYDSLSNPRYVAPEQISGKPTDHRTDIYRLGATLFHLMAGHPPFEAETSDAVCLAHLKEAFPEKKARSVGVPDAWIDLMERMMEKDPKKRFQSYEQIANALLIMA